MSAPSTSAADVVSGLAAFPAGLRVLVVDDDLLCLKVVEKMLKTCGYAGTCAERDGAGDPSGEGRSSCVTTEDATRTTNGRDRMRACDGDNFYARDHRTNARHSSSPDASRARARDNPECPYPSDGWIGDVTRRVRAECASDAPVRMREY